ncbi:MAG TPA: AraC family transcriptional regulator, partial [Pedobacter sp.]
EGKLAYLQEKAEISLEPAGITGLMDACRVFKNTGYTGTVLVVFKETGAAHFLKHPVHELFGESLSLHHFFNPVLIRETEEQLATAADDEQRISIVERLLTGHLQNDKEYSLVDQAIAYIRQSGGRIRIAELARCLNISQSPLEKQFRRITGASPKKFSSIVRFKNLTEMLTIQNYQELIYQAGYYDQAHLIKDFKKFSGKTPEQYVKGTSGSSEINDFLQSQESVGK